MSILPANDVAMLRADALALLPSTCTWTTRSNGGTVTASGNRAKRAEGSASASTPCRIGPASGTEGAPQGQREEFAGRIADVMTHVLTLPHDAAIEPDAIVTVSGEGSGTFRVVAVANRRGPWDVIVRAAIVEVS